MIQHPIPIKPNHDEGLVEVECWITQEEARHLYSGAFWNDQEVEKGKEWWIEDGSDGGELRAHLERSGSLAEFHTAIRLLKESAKLKGRVLDAAAGTCWTAALLSRFPEVDHIDAVELSWHRITFLAERTIDELDGIPSKISRIFGSFLDVHRPDHIYDIVFLSAAFHHCAEVVWLLAELDRCLAPNGAMVLIGERPVTWTAQAWRMASTLVRRRQLLFEYRELFPPHPETGDHYYRRSDYVDLFGGFGYRLHIERIGRKNHVLVASKSKL